MDRINQQTSENPEIYFKDVKGSLRIKGWDRSEIRADSDKSDTLNIESTDNKVTITCESGCMVRVPIESTLQIDNVDRELMLKSIECSIEVDNVSGQVMVKSIGSLKIQKASSNLIAKNVEGIVECQVVGGNANLQDIEGAINLGKVNGNLTVKGFVGGIKAETNGNATLRVDPEAGGIFDITANGNISCRLSPDTSAKIKLISNSQNIKITKEGSSETIKQAEHEVIIGESLSQMTLIANGNIDLKIPVQEDVDWEYEFDFGEDVTMVAEDISQIVTEQLETQLESLSENLSSLTNNLSTIGPFASQRSREKLEAKRMQLERKLARVERRATEKARKASRRAAASSRRYGQRKKSSSDPVSDSERQKVLDMLQNKQISVKEAELLLATLEGRSPDYPQAKDANSDQTE